MLNSNVLIINQLARNMHKPANVTHLDAAKLTHVPAMIFEEGPSERPFSRLEPGTGPISKSQLISLNTLPSLLMGRTRGHTIEFRILLICNEGKPLNTATRAKGARANAKKKLEQGGYITRAKIGYYNLTPKGKNLLNYYLGITDMLPK